MVLLLFSACSSDVILMYSHVNGPEFSLNPLCKSLRGRKVVKYALPYRQIFSFFRYSFPHNSLSSIGFYNWAHLTNDNNQVIIHCLVFERVSLLIRQPIQTLVFCFL